MSMAAFTEREVLELAAVGKRMAYRLNAEFVLDVERLKMCGFTKRKAKELAARSARRLPK